MLPHILVFITTKSKQEAETIANSLLEKKLIACANIVEHIDSFFWWQNKIDSSREALLIAKSRKELFEQILAVVKEKHSYELPEIIAIPLVNADEDYLKWLDESIKRKEGVK